MEKTIYLLCGHGGRITNGLGQELSKRGYDVVGRENVEDFKKEIECYKKFLNGMSADASLNTNTDLMNIRDELLSNLNQFSYLLTFK